MFLPNLAYLFVFHVLYPCHSGLIPISTVRKMDTETKNKIPEDAGVSKRWLEAIVTQEITKPKQWTEDELKVMTPKKGSSIIQRLMQGFYYSLVDGLNEFTQHGDNIEGPDEDLFDGWYDENGTNIGGPPPRPLRRLGILIEGEDLIIKKEGPE